MLDHTGIMVEAALDGLGIAYDPKAAARAALNNKRLVVLLQDWSPVIPGLCFYYPGHRHVPAGLRAFIDLLKTTVPIERKAATGLYAHGYRTLIFNPPDQRKISIVLSAAPRSKVRFSLSPAGLSEPGRTPPR